MAKKIINPITKKEDTLVETIQEVDLSQLKFPVISIYEYPVDYPDEYVARIFDLDKPTSVIMKASCLWLLKFDIEKHTAFTFVEPFIGDPYNLVGTYF